jgi:phospholipase/carboxylesterase
MPLLPCVEIEPTEPHRATVLWLHGLGASGHDFPPIVPALRMPWARFVFPHAPRRPVTINGGVVMPSWYDIRHLNLQAPDREDEAQILESTAAIEALLAREEQRLPSTRVVLAGFSQGGALALHVGHRHAHRLAGLVVLSGYLVRPSALGEGHPTNADTPLLFMHGRHDEVLPSFGGRLAYESCLRLNRDMTWKDYPMGHEVCPEQIADLGRWLRERLA